MTYHLSRLRLVSVGDRAARFTDLTADLTSSGLDDFDAAPTDSIVWLRNGGGKSSLLSLFFALLLPLRKDFLGKAVKRQLEDYVATGDTSHTVAEWVGTEGQRLVTGAVYEWAERRKPADPERDRSKLRCRYYAFFAVPGVVGLDTLPLDDEAGRRRPLADFVRCLDDLAKARPAELRSAITEERGAWMDALVARNLDPALFRYQKQMNHSEGGVAELFDFPTTEKFIDFLIELTVDNAQPDLVAANLKRIIDVLGRKPQLLIDRDFCAELAGKLDSLAEKHERAVAAQGVATASRVAAATLGGAFDAAAHALENDARWYGEEAVRLSGAATKLDTERNRRNDTANELYRVAAMYRQATAQSAFDEAEELATKAKNDSLAWEAVRWLAEVVEVEATKAMVNAQLAEEEHRTAPLRAARDEAAVVLRSRYLALAYEEESADAEAGAAAEAADERAEQEDRLARRDQKKATEAETRAEGLNGRAIEIDQAVGSAVDRGDLPDAAAQPSAVLAELRKAKREALEERDKVGQRRMAVPEQRRLLAEERARIASEQASKTAERDQLTELRQELVSRVEVLAADERLAELTQLEGGGRLDLWAEATALRSALTHAAGVAEIEIVDTRVDAADDDRALEGLRTETFLPTTRDAQRAAETLVANGVTARPGWQLLRDLVAENDRAVVLANAQVAELAAGVVVADGDADQARALISSGSWSAVAHVAVCTASQLQQVLQEAAPEWIAVPNDPALYDELAAESARTMREVRRHEQDQLIEMLHEQAARDRELLRILNVLLIDCPSGHLEGLKRSIGELDELVDQYKDRDSELATQLQKLEQQDAEDARSEKLLSEQVTALTATAERLETLARAVAELPELHRLIAQYGKDASAYAEAARDLARRARDSRLEARAARERAIGHRKNGDRYRIDAGEISLLDAERAPGAETDEPLSVLLDRFDELDLSWRTETSRSVLAERLNNLNDRLRKARRELDDCESVVRERARELLTTGDGQDVSRRASAIARSRDAAYAAQRELSTTKSELDQAAEQVKARTPRDRQRHAQLEIEPATEAEARRLAEEAAAQATEMSNQATGLQREAAEAASEASSASASADLFQQRVNRLRDAAAPTPIAEGVPAYGGDIDAEVVLNQALEKLRLTVEAATQRSAEADQALTIVRRIAAESRFAGVPAAMRDRLTADDADSIATRAAVRAADFRLRRTTIEGQLADIGRDQRLIVVEVAAMVREVLATLDSAQRHSKLPGTLGGWGNEHFLRIRFTRPSGEDDLYARIETVIDRIVAEKSKPEGLALLKRCVHEAVAPRGFAVKVLKPNSDLAVEPVEVTQLGKFSGGEKLTVCVALYCTLARLRAVNRGQGKTASGGTLVLDNPLGTASHVALLRLQRDVAAAHGVQLVYTTGVEDLGAVGQFPNVLRLRNAPGALRTRRYVVLDEGITSARLNRSES